jgi:hypothetical protein
VEIATNDIALKRALVVMVAGTQPELTHSDVQAYIMGHFDLPSGSFMVHVHHPEDFLVLFGTMMSCSGSWMPPPLLLGPTGLQMLEEGERGRVVAHGLQSAAWHSGCASSPLAS